MSTGGAGSEGREKSAAVSGKADSSLAHTYDLLLSEIKYRLIHCQSRPALLD